VGALSTERIEAQLRDYGVRHSRERFLALAEATDSAWTISDAWIEQDPVACTGKQVARRTLAACLLRLGSTEEAASVLLRLVERWPRVVWSHVALADAHSHLFRGACNLDLDLDRARHFLERALALGGWEGGDREVLGDRLAEIEERRSRPQGAPP
jgi:hypothetical protein